MKYNLCKEFPALSPLQLDSTSFHRVIKLYADLRKRQIKEKQNYDPVTGERIVYRKATTWY